MCFYRKTTTWTLSWPDTGKPDLVESVVLVSSMLLAVASRLHAKRLGAARV